MLARIRYAPIPSDAEHQGLTVVAARRYVAPLSPPAGDMTTRSQQVCADPSPRSD